MLVCLREILILKKYQIEIYFVFCLLNNNLMPLSKSHISLYDGHIYYYEMIKSNEDE